jgi:two-component system, NtrC family, nitrogen regulation sensor histidine kinase NtrY
MAIFRLGRSFRARLIVSISTLVVTAGTAGYVVGSQASPLWLVPLGSVILWSLLATLRRSERVVRDVRYFLEALRQNDYSVRIAGKRDGASYRAMGNAMEKVLADFRARRAEQQERIRFLENVVEHVGTAVLAYTAEGEITLLNAAARRLLDVHRARHMESVVERAPAVVEALHRLERGGQTLATIAASDGNARHVLVHSTRILVGGTSHVLAAMYDIGSELEEREMQAWQQLTRVLTHEIMNSVAPIASLAGTVEKLAGVSDGDDDIGEALSVIKRRSEALINFVDAYRSFTRIPTPEYELTRVKELLSRVARLMRAEAERSNLRIEVDVDPAESRLAADPSLIEQVLINLVLNAIQASTGRNGVVVLRSRADRRGIPVIDVEDNGPGIADSVMEQIFVPFFTTKPDGSGIGLSLSRQIMRLHGGSITARSEPGRTTFTLRF